MVRGMAAGLGTLLVAGSIFGGTLAATAADGAIDVPDAGLRACLEGYVGSPITDEAAANAPSYINCSNRDIADLEGIQYFTPVSTLNLDRNRITDLTPLGGLIALQQVFLYDSQVADLTPLMGLSRLHNLEVGSNHVSDLSPLAGMTSLERLDIGSNQASDLSPLADLTSLERLNIHNNGVSDLSPLAGMASLGRLDAYSNSITDLSPLAGATLLWSLDVSSNQISDLSPLAGLTSLNNLTASFNQVEDVEPLKGLTKLGGLELSNNHIADISPLAELTNLQSLGLSRNQILDVSPLAGMTPFWDFYVHDQLIDGGRLIVDELYINPIRDLAGKPVAATAENADFTGLDWSFSKMGEQRAEWTAEMPDKFYFSGTIVFDVVEEEVVEPGKQINPVLSVSHNEAVAAVDTVEVFVHVLDEFGQPETDVEDIHVTSTFGEISSTVMVEDGVFRATLVSEVEGEATVSFTHEDIPNVEQTEQVVFSAPVAPVTPPTGGGEASGAGNGGTGALAASGSEFPAGVVALGALAAAALGGGLMVLRRRTANADQG